MSTNSYSRTKMFELADTLKPDELFRNAKIAEQKGHQCNHCFNCVCKEVYDRDIQALVELRKEILIDKLANATPFEINQIRFSHE